MIVPRCNFCDLLKFRNGGVTQIAQCSRSKYQQKQAHDVQCGIARDFEKCAKPMREACFSFLF